jgi:hypothetical protein
LPAAPRLSVWFVHDYLRHSETTPCLLGRYKARVVGRLSFPQSLRCISRTSSVVARKPVRDPFRSPESETAVLSRHHPACCTALGFSVAVLDPSCIRGQSSLVASSGAVPGFGLSTRSAGQGWRWITPTLSLALLCDALTRFPPYFYTGSRRRRRDRLPPGGALSTFSCCPRRTNFLQDSLDATLGTRALQDGRWARLVDTYAAALY